MEETKTYEKLEDGRVKITTATTTYSEKIISKEEISERKKFFEERIAALQSELEKDLQELGEALNLANTKTTK